MKKILIIIILGYLTGCSSQDEKIDKSKLIGYDYRLFQETPVWTLAKAVEAEDTSRIRKEIFKNKINPDYQEARYGNTLLMMSIFNNDYASTRALLNAGADPNLRDKHRGATAVIDAAANRDLKYLKLLLIYKGNPNVVEDKLVEDDDSPMQTALTSAISYYGDNSLEKVMLLVESGAQVNYPNNNTIVPIGVAIKRDKMDIAFYLLEKGADYKKVMYKMINGHNVYILEALRKNILELKSVDYQKKLAIITFLKNKGLDYHKEPIPDYVLKEIKTKYPKNWKEYAEKY